MYAEYCWTVLLASQCSKISAHKVAHRAEPYSAKTLLECGPPSVKSSTILGERLLIAQNSGGHICVMKAQRYSATVLGVYLAYQAES